MDSVKPLPRQSDARLVSVIGWMASAVALTAALLFPVGYVSLAYSNLASLTALQARVDASEISTLVSGNPEFWMYELHRMEGLLARYSAERDDHTASVYDAKGNLLIRVGALPEPPLLSRSYAVYDSGRAVGRVEIARSLRVVAYGALAATLLGLLLGGVVFTVLRVLPLRALRQMTEALERERETLRESEERYRTVADFTHDWEYWLAPDGSLPYVSPSCKHITGYLAEEFQQDPGLLVRIVHPDDRGRLCDHLHAATAQEDADRHHEGDFRIVTRDGEERWLNHVCRAVYNGSGQYLGRRASNRDITERKRAEQELRIAAAAFDAQEGIIVTDAKAVILRVNQAFTDMTGYSPEQTVGQTPHFFSSGRHDAAFFSAMWDSINRTGSWKGEVWARRQNGEAFSAWATVSAVRGNDGEVTQYVGTLTDISQRKAAEAAIEHLAFYDSLTLLPNRRLLLDRLQHAIAASARSREHGALLFIDLDNFKTLNDTRGHDVGDLLLRGVARRLASSVREGDTVARLGGDEYVVVLEHLSEGLAEAVTQVETVAEKILSKLNQPYTLDGQEHQGTASIGISLFASYGHTVDDLLKQADLAMYKAKAAGRSTLRFFDPEMQAAATARAALEVELRRAIRESQFLLFYQPQVDGGGRMTGAEALVRWQHPQRGLVCPAEFIPLAEETGLILPLGRWVLESACAQLAAWGTKSDTARLALAVNVSAREFHHPEFASRVLEALDQTGANPKKLTLEFTESLLLQDMEDAITKMTALKDEGVVLSLDDFGTGYSSLRYVKHLPLDQLKIDRSFVRDVLTDPNDAAIARAILALGQSLDLAVTAEGIETEAQRDFLASNGCHAFQGYLFGQPVPVEWLEAKTKIEAG
jgi:diguanylate cyclase (GGDEF)-like protein/PAS domain S-box-containing protein